MLVFPVSEIAAQEPSEPTKKLFHAINDGNLEKVQVSITDGSDINALNAWGITPVDLAIDKGHFDIVHDLLLVHDLQKKGGGSTLPIPAARFTTLSTAPDQTQFRPKRPKPSKAPVAEIYAPPLEAGPWSATVVTSESPTPAVVKGPSPFDLEPETTMTIPIIGIVRGPTEMTSGKIVNTTVRATIEATIKEVGRKQIKPKPLPKKNIPKINVKPQQVSQVAQSRSKPPQSKSIANDDSGNMGDIKKFLRFDDEPKIKTLAPHGHSQKPAPFAKALAEAKSTPVVEVVRSASLEQTSAPAIKTKIPPPDTSRANITRIDNYKTAAPTKIVEGTSGRSPVQVGTTTLPGKRPDQEGFFNSLMSIFSSNKEKTTSAEKLDQNGQSTKKEIGDWSVRNVQKARVIPHTPTKKIALELPDNRLIDVVLSLGRTMTLGKAQPPQAPAPWYYKSCTNQKQSLTVFCIEPLDWPKAIQPYLLTDSILYEGTQSIVRYDEGAATYFHFLFPAQSYPLIIKYFSSRYGTPTQKLKRFIAPLAEPRRINPTVIWQSIAPVTNLLTTLEVRMYDDNRGGFPDTKRGAVYLYHEWSQPVFQQLSMVELMLLRSEVKLR